MKKIGIYKITSPSGKVYIGQSIDIDKRFKQYKRHDCKKQYILYKSLIKYGFDNHFFEIITLCEVSQLNNLERYYQDLYCVLSDNGMNLRLTEANDRCGMLSKELKDKISRNRKGKYFITEKEKKHLSFLNKGIKRPEWVGRKISESKKGIKFSLDHKQKLSKAKKGRKLSDLTKEKMKMAAKERNEINNNKTEEIILNIIVFLIDNNCNYFIHRVLGKKPIIKSNINIKITGIESSVSVWWHFNKLYKKRLNKSVFNHYHINSFEDFIQKYNELIFKYS